MKEEEREVDDLFNIDWVTAIVVVAGGMMMVVLVVVFIVVYRRRRQASFDSGLVLANHRQPSKPTRSRPFYPLLKA